MTAGKDTFDTEESFGLRLIKTRTDKLEGTTVDVKRGKGTASTIRFKG